ncbi:mitochondrial K+-H+ exchange-related-domain-containing protein [Mycena sp. CBHHK59/15]|nr:mitochondrial K+-H+ exchange-related-domain-containing protein [Mycena sp. CBHHK59/15]
MASLRKTWGTMRIAALPLTRAAQPLAHPSQRIITYYSFKTVPPSTPPKPERAVHDPPPPLLARWLPEEGVVKWAAYKVDSTWSGWGMAERGSWRLRVFEFGERFLDKMDFEESMLKAIDMSIAPPAKVPDGLTGQEKADAEAEWSKLRVPLLFPPAVSSGSSALEDLRHLLEKRIPLHKKGFYTYLVIAPLTTPFMIIPIIPNLPFFFCAWRSWSHYQALRAARRIDALLQGGKIVPEAHAALDAVYTDADADAKQQTVAPDAPQAQTVIVTPASLGHAMRVLDMKPNEVTDVLRAYEQAGNRVRLPR